MNNHIDIIIPVYKGYEETVKCIKSVLEHRNPNTDRVVLINDNSPDGNIVELIVNIKGENVFLFHNADNLGFVQSVNKGMRFSAKNDVILLNSDTEVCGDWIGKLRKSAYFDEKIGTVTPMSNSATICSYPRFCHDNQLPLGTSIAKMDGIFETVSDNVPIQTPTGVGFCMYIKRELLNTIGFFDEVSFGKGYGEENDFCMRANQAGWTNVIATNTYIYHSGSASFGDSKRELIASGMSVLKEKYPKYESEIQSFISRDELRGVRIKADFKRFSSDNIPAILFVTHNMQGGTRRCVSEMGIEWLKQGIRVFVLKPQGKNVIILSGDPNDSFTLKFNIIDDYQDLLALCKAFKIYCIHYHHLLGYDSQIQSLPKDLEVAYYVLLHDYYMICPRVSLTQTNNKFCEEKGVELCQRCLKEYPHSFSEDIERWRENHFLFLSEAKGITTPSNDAVVRFKKYYPSLLIKSCPHAEFYQFNGEFPKRILGDKLKIGIIGAISKIKGADFIYSCAEDKKNRNLPLEYIIIGYTHKQATTSEKYDLKVLGAYKEEDSLQLIRENDIDIMFFPARCPETYSYTLSYSILANIPIVATDIGAVAERVNESNIGWVVNKDINSAQMNNFFMDILNNQDAYDEKVGNLGKVILKHKYQLTDYYDHNDFSINPHNKVELDVDAFIKKYDVVSLNTFHRRVLSFFIKRKNYPILRNIVELIGDKGKQRIKKLLGI